MTRNADIVFFFLILLALAQLSGCTPAMRQAAQDKNVAAARQTAPSIRTRQPAMATVNTRSLRVRGQPSTDAPVIWGVNSGEKFAVIGRSSDGMWLQLELPKAPEGEGWVSADLVTVEGSIADAVIVEAPTPRPLVRATSTSVGRATSPIATPFVTPTPGATPGGNRLAGTPLPTSAATVIVLLPTATPTPVATQFSAPVGYALVVTDGARLRVRAAPNADAEIVGYIYPGETYRVLEISTDALWTKIAGAENAPSDNPQGGWVASSFLVIRPASSNE